MVTLELAEEFVVRGWQVDVFTNHLDFPFAHEFDYLLKQGSLSISDNAVPHNLGDYDLIWVHHAVLPQKIIQELSQTGKRVPMVWHHMSPFPGIESPMLAEVEMSFASVITCISPKTRETLTEYGIPEAQVMILPNPAPRAFENSPPPSIGAPLKQLVIVSNHPPEELIEAVKALNLRDIQTTIIGGESPERVTPESFAGVDAVITIGKSVQYALSLGLPVYIYDHFGGEGWLRPSNFDVERSFNFSGRSTKRELSPDQLVDEITSGYAAAQRFAISRIDDHRDLFSLRRYVNELLEKARIPPTTEIKSSSPLARRWETFAQIQRDNTRAHHGTWPLTKALQQTVETQQDALSDYARQLTALRQSRSFRLIQTLLRPFARFRRP